MTDFASHDGDEDRLLEASPPDTSLDSQPESPGVEQISSQEHDKMTRLLYTSHFLSTWNSRLFEFGAFLFLAKIYPQTLLPASVYALSRAASAALFSPWLGSLIDRADRLKVVRLSIVAQRLSVVVSCVGFLIILRYKRVLQHNYASIGILVGLSVLACVEKVSSVLNTISVERDWVVIVANGHDERLRLLNSQMRRIDLFCKLIGPLAIASVDSISSSLAMIVTGSTTVISILVEYFTIARVYDAVPALRARKPLPVTRQRSRNNAWTSCKTYFAKTGRYMRHPAFLPSFSLALLHLTVLSFSGQMITYLIALDVSSGLIGVLRGISALFEICATWIAPKIMTSIGPVRAGIWFLNWEITCLAVACAFFWWDVSPTIVAAGTVSMVVASRIGLWGFDLSAQIIVQDEVEEHDRGTFSSQEFALQNFFEMLAFASTIIFPNPIDFKYPATISALAVGSAGVLYAIFVRSRRGHLVHFCKCIDRKEMRNKHHHWWQVAHGEEEPILDAEEPDGTHERVEDE